MRNETQIQVESQDQVNNEEDSQEAVPNVTTISTATASPPKSTDDTDENNVQAKETPGKLLTIVAPLPEAISNVKSRGGKVAQLLTSPENLERVKKLEISRKKKAEVGKSKENHNAKKKKNCVSKNTAGPSGVNSKTNLSNSSKKLTVMKKKNRKESDSSETSDDFSTHDSNSSFGQEEDEACVGCGEQWGLTNKKQDWIQCIHCSRWLHEGCTGYRNICQPCGKFLTVKK